MPGQVIPPSQHLPTEITLSLGLFVAPLLGMFGVCHPSMLMHVFVCSKTVASFAARASAKVAVDRLRMVQEVLPEEAPLSPEGLRYAVIVTSGRLT